MNQSVIQSVTQAIRPVQDEDQSKELNSDLTQRSLSSSFFDSIESSLNPQLLSELVFTTRVLMDGWMDGYAQVGGVGKIHARIN